MNAILTNIVNGCGRAYCSFLRQRLVSELGAHRLEPSEPVSGRSSGKRVNGRLLQRSGTDSHHAGVVFRSFSTYV
jgi:hypothetical protein